MKQVILVTLILISCSFYGQERPGGKRPNGKNGQGRNQVVGEIYGQVIDSITNEALGYATVSMYKLPAKELVNGTVTKSSGKFTLEQVPAGRYELSVSFIGYVTKVFGPFTIDESNLALNVKSLKIAPNTQQLGPVLIEGSMPEIRYEIDKKVVDVSKQTTDLGQTAVEVLENVPSINVDADGNVSLRGSSSFTLLIDGKPTVMDASDALNTIPASTLANIEIITNPSAKFDAEGVSGIINIVTKKKRLEGVSLLINGNGGIYDTYGGDMALNYRKGDIEFNISGNYNNRYRPNYRYSERVNYGDSVTNTVFNNNESSRGGYFYGGKGELIWSPNSGHSLSVGGSYRMRTMNSESLGVFEEFTNESLINKYTNEETTTREFPGFSTYMTYRLNFNRNQKHYLEFRGMVNNRSGEELLLTNFLDSEGNLTGGTKTTETGPSNMIRFNVDYSQEFESGQTLEFGGQYQIGTSGDVGETFFYDPESGEYVLQELYSSDVSYDRDIGAAYALFKGMTLNEKLGYQFGIRAEHTDRFIEATGLDQTTSIDRLDWFPSAHFSYEISKKDQILMNYSRRINRPRSYYFEPFISWQSQYQVYRGNPDLKPEYINALEMNYIHTIKGKGSLSLETYFRHTYNLIERAYSIYQDNIVLQSPTNFGHSYSLGIEPSFNYRVTDWWKADLSMNIYRFEVNSSLNDREDIRTYLNWNANTRNTFTLWKNWQLQVTGRYNGPSGQAQGSSEGYFTSNASIKRSFQKNKYALSLQVRDIFSSIENRSTIVTEDLYIYTISEPRTPTFSISCSVRINNYSKRNNMEQDADDF